MKLRNLFLGFSFIFSIFPDLSRHFRFKPERGPVLIFMVPALFFLLLSGYGVYSWSHIPWSTDTFLAVIPDYFFNIQIYHHGFIPLWDPNLGCGHPHFAKWLPACCYPPCLFLTWTGIQGLFFLTLLHAGWTFQGFYLWLRSQKCSIHFSFLGSLSFSGSALFVRCWLDSPFLFTLSWIPWIFWAFNKTLAEDRSCWWVLSALFLSLQILAGYPFFAFYTWIALFIWLLYHRPSRNQWKSILKSLVLALGLTSAQWFPFIEFLTYSFRGGWEHFPYFTQPIECLTLLFPQLAGDPSNYSYRGLPANGNFGNLYFGLIPFVLFIAGWFLPRRFQNRFFNFSALGFFLWLLGPTFPPLRLIPQNWIEILDPSKAVGLFLFCACTSMATTGSKFFENQKLKKTWRPWLWVAGILWAMDLLLLPCRLLHWVPNPYQNPSVELTWRNFAPQTEGFRVLSLQTHDQWTFTHLEDFSLENANLLMMNSNEIWGIRSANGYISTQTQSLRNLGRYFQKGFPYPGDLLDVAGVKFLILPQIPLGGKYKAVGRFGKDFLLLNPGAAPRGWSVTGTEFFSDRSSVLQALSQPETPWRKTVFLEKSPGDAPLALAATGRKLNPTTPEPALGNRMTFKVDLPQPGYWVFNETWAPGWHAWVDGIPSPILRADGLFMAVNLPLKGSHQVDFRYEPTSFRLGLFLSLLTAILAAARILKSYFWSRRI